MQKVKIRKHLIPFLFREFAGKDAQIGDKKSKSIKIYPFSTMGALLYSQLQPHVAISKKDHYILYLYVERGQYVVDNACLYMQQEGTYKEVLVPAHKVRYINDFLENIFRISFMYFMDGFVQVNKKDGDIAKGVEFFIERYDLYEYGFENETLRRLYYRELGKDRRLARLQNQSSNRVKNY